MGKSLSGWKKSAMSNTTRRIFITGSADGITSSSKRLCLKSKVICLDEVSTTCGSGRLR